MSQATGLAVQNRGVHELHLTFDPQSSFFTKHHETVTPFARETRIFQINPNTVAFDRQMFFEIDRIGDLHGESHLRVELPALNQDGLGVAQGGARYVDHIAAQLFQYITLKFGHVEYDTLTPETLEIVDELEIPNDLRSDKESGKANGDNVQLAAWATTKQIIYIRLPWSFSKHTGHYFPAVSSFLSKIEVFLRARAKTDIAVAEGTYGAGLIYNPALDANLVLGNVSLVVEIFLLDEPERESFGNNYLSYIFLQHQNFRYTIRAGSTDWRQEIKMSHTVRSYYFIFRTATALAAKDYGNFDGLEVGEYAGHAFKTFKMKLNQADRCEPQDPIYMSTKIPAQVHSRKPSKKIYVFTNCLDAEAIDYNGGVNHSRLDTMTVELTFGAALAEDLQIDIMVKAHNVCELEAGVFRVLYGG